MDKNIENLLELEGVNAKGYGIISQAVMFDRDLSTTAKAIYAYLCSYLGAGRTIFPKVTTILSDLQIAKNTFYKHFNLLLENGYIKRSKAKGFLNRNIYIICNNVEKLKTPVYNSKATESQLAIDGINASGYGFVPKLIMTDRRISAKAKALIAFLYSIAQADSCAYPHRLTICTFLQMSKDAYYKALNQLIEYDYIAVHQRHNDKGHFSVNDYILNSNPKSSKNELCPDFCDYGENGLNKGNSPCPDFCDYGENGLNKGNSPCPDFCDYGEDSRVLKIETLPCPENCDNNNITSNNITIISNKSSSNLQVEKIQNTNDIEEIGTEIRKLSWYDYYLSLKQSANDVEFVTTYLATVNALIDMVGQESACYGKEYVNRERFVRLLSECIEDDTVIAYDDNLTDYIPAYNYSLRDLIFAVVDNFTMATNKYDIRKPKQYLRTLIWDNVKNFI